MITSCSGCGAGELIRILLLGATGVVGTHMAAEMGKAHEVKTVSRSSKGADIAADVSDGKALEKIIAQAKPEALINAVKPSMPIDAMEQDKQSTYELNTMLPERLAAMQGKYGYLLVQISTDWVYEGREGTVYGEDSLLYPRNYYAYTKAVAEERVRQHAPRHLILRAEGVFGMDSRGANPFLRIRQCAMDGKQFPAPADQYSQPISGAELARAARALIEKGATGTYNSVGPEYLSRFEFAQRVGRAAGWACDIKETSIKDRKIPIPQFLRVDAGKLERIAGQIRPLERQMRDLRVFLDGAGN